MTPAPEESYYGAIESHFVLRRGAPLFITPREWSLVARWEEQSIPLHVVKDGIDRVFERPLKSSRPPKLSYCRQTVEAAFRRFRERALGGGKTEREEEPFDLAAYLDALVAAVRKLPEGLAGTVAEEVESLARAESDFGSLERALSALDERLVDAAKAALDEAARRELERDAEDSLASYRERMPDKVYRSALESATRRRLRARFQLPRLTLLDR